MMDRIHSEKHATRGARIIFMLTSFSLFFFGFETDGAATPVPRQLYGKSVSVSWTQTEALLNETAGRFFNWRAEMTSTFYFSSVGRIFARRSTSSSYGSRTFEQVGSEPHRDQRPILATGSGQGSAGTSAGTFRDLHFEGRTLIAIQRVGENGARRTAIEFDQNFGSCTSTVVFGSDNGKPIRRTGWKGESQVVSGETRSQPSCVIRDGNAFQQ
jgi:hypothetical protein